MRYELETSWHVVIALAPLIGCDWALPACRRWNEDVFLPFRLGIFEIALVLVRLDHVASCIAATERVSLCVRMKS
jgi:hypothetical protein